ncbi:MAG: hypothetical protein ACYTG1_11410 [Planctomycetota bacterium]|jgi:hypothetical protein
MHARNDATRRGGRLPRSRAALIALATTMTVLLGAAPARAGHDRSPGERDRGHACVVDGCGRIDCREHRRARVEFERGFDIGQRAGRRIGLEDGTYGRRFCPEPRRSLRHVSRPFRAGYLATFGDAYAVGFRQGRRTCGPPAYRPGRGHGFGHGIGRGHGHGYGFGRGPGSGRGPWWRR